MKKLKEIVRIMFPVAAKRFPLFFPLEALKTLCDILMPFIAIFVTPLIVDELVGGRDLTRLFIYAGILILGECLLTPTKIYVKPILALLEQVTVKGISHITGGGFFENIPRCLKSGLSAKIDESAVRVLPIFDLIAEKGNIPRRDMFNTFNMGVGMSVVVAKEDAGRAVEILRAAGEDAYIMGELVESEEGVILC